MVFKKYFSKYYGTEIKVAQYEENKILVINIMTGYT